MKCPVDNLECIWCSPICTSKPEPKPLWEVLRDYTRRPPEPPEAPIWLDNNEAASWQNGWESGYVAALAAQEAHPGRRFAQWFSDHGRHNVTYYPLTKERVRELMQLAWDVSRETPTVADVNAAYAKGRADGWEAKEAGEAQPAAAVTPHAWKGHAWEDQAHCAKCGRLESDPIHSAQPAAAQEQ